MSHIFFTSVCEICESVLLLNISAPWEHRTRATPQLAAFSDCDLYDAAVPALAGVETIVVSHAVREVGFHRGMARFYRRFDAPGHNPLVNAAVFLGIGAKLVTSLAITAVRGR
jgi:hypothetical protein